MISIVTICDFYTANSRRWTILDPVRAVTTTWVSGWIDAAILTAIAAAIGAHIWNEKRRARAREEVERRAYEAWLREQEDADEEPG
jgi:hypothetical protein